MMRDQAEAVKQLPLFFMLLAQDQCPCTSPVSFTSKTAKFEILNHRFDNHLYRGRGPQTFGMLSNSLIGQSLELDYNNDILFRNRKRHRSMITPDQGNLL